MKVSFLSAAALLLGGGALAQGHDCVVEIQTAGQRLQPTFSFGYGNRTAHGSSSAASAVAASTAAGGSVHGGGGLALRLSAPTEVSIGGREASAGESHDLKIEDLGWWRGAKSGSAPLALDGEPVPGAASFEEAADPRLENLAVLALPRLEPAASGVRLSGIDLYALDAGRGLRLPLELPPRELEKPRVVLRHRFDFDADGHNELELSYRYDVAGQPPAELELEVLVDGPLTIGGASTEAERACSIRLADLAQGEAYLRCAGGEEPLAAKALDVPAGELAAGAPAGFVVAPIELEGEAALLLARGPEGLALPIELR